MTRDDEFLLRMSILGHLDTDPSSGKCILEQDADPPEHLPSTYRNKNGVQYECIYLSQKTVWEVDLRRLDPDPET